MIIIKTMNSRNILIIAIVALLVIVVIGLSFLFFAPKGTPTTGTTTGQTGVLPNAGNQSNPGGATGSSSSSANTAGATIATSFGVISQEPVLDYFVDAANTVTAIKPDGTIVQITAGQTNTISSITIQNILSASFSYDGAKILVSFGNTSNPQVSVFDVIKKAWTPLAAGLLFPVWSPSDYRIAYYTANPAQGTETFATVDSSKAKPAPVAITTLHAQDLAIAWPSKNQLVFYTKPSAYTAGSAWVYNLQKATLTPVATEVPGLTTLWSGSAFTSSSPMGLSFSTNQSGSGGSLSLIDLAGNTIQQLKLSTVPSKCFFASATSTVAVVQSTSTRPVSATSTPYLFCGVPRDQNTFLISHLPDDYNQMALFTSDDIYRINLQNGALDIVFNDPSQNLDLSDIKFFNSTLFFINRYDQKLYGVRLN